MANVLGKFYSGVKLRKGVTPESPTELIGVQPYPLNPPGSGNFVTIDTDQIITGEKTFDGKVRVNDNSLRIANPQSGAGIYDKLSLDFGEGRGIGYDGFSNEVFVGDTLVTPVKIAGSAPTDSLNVLSTGGIKMANIPTGTAVNTLGLDSNNEIVKGSGSGGGSLEYLLDPSEIDVTTFGTATASFDLNSESITVVDGDYIELRADIAIASRDANGLISNPSFSIGNYGGSIPSIGSGLNWGSIGGRYIEFFVRLVITATGAKVHIRIKGSAVGGTPLYNSIYYDFVQDLTVTNTPITNANVRLTFGESNAANYFKPIFGTLKIFKQ